MRINLTPFVLFPLLLVAAYFLGGPTAAGITAGLLAVITFIVN